MTRPRHPYTMAVHPTSQGLGWVVFEGPFAPLDWGLASARKAKDRNSACLHRVEELLGRFLPETLVLETFERRISARRTRITRLCRAIVALAVGRGVDVSIVSRADIQACFSSVGARTRQEIAEAVVRHVDMFRSRLPKKRRAWESEDPRLALFSAAALVLTYYRFGASRLFDSLKGKP